MNHNWERIWKDTVHHDRIEILLVAKLPVSLAYKEWGDISSANQKLIIETSDETWPEPKVMFDTSGATP